MKKYTFRDFENNPAYLMFRLDAKVAGEYVDLYMLMHLPSEYLLSHEVIEKEISQSNIDVLLGFIPPHATLPQRVLLAKNDPAEPFLKKAAGRYGLVIETVSSASVQPLLTTIRQTFSAQFKTTLGLNHDIIQDPDERASAQQFITDSYAPCPCASGKLYKSCCKSIFEEITYAMVAAEDGYYKEALHLMDQAKNKVGETPEVLCRESIVYSFFDEKKSKKLLKQCLNSYPGYPRAYYIHGIDLKEKGDLKGALLAYKKAIQLYPETAHFQLNEAYNNLGTIYYELDDMKNAAIAWQKALVYLPSDDVCRDNLKLIYGGTLHTT